MSPQFPTIVLRAQSDEKLARLVASGNERAFEAIVDRYKQPLLRYATRIIGDSRADDVVQAAFVSAWTKLAEGEDVRDLKAWLYRIVHNGALNAMKRASSRDLPLLADNPLSTGDDSQAEVEQREAVREMLGEIAALPEQQRRAFLAVAVDGRRHRDVGLELGVSEGAVRMLIHRARSSVRAAAAAFSPGPLIAWFKGLGGGGAAAGGSSGIAAAGSSAGAGVLATGVVKIGVIVAASAVAATAGPPAVKQIQSQISAAPQHAAVVTKATPAAPAKGHVGDTHGDRPASVPADTAPAAQPAPASEQSAPPPAADSAPAVATAEAPVAEQNFAVAIPPASQPRFIAPAQGDDDLILVEEDPPDYAAGERDVPLDGLPANSGVDVNLPDPPDETSVADTTDTTPPAADTSTTADPAATDTTAAADAAASGNAPATTTP